MTEPCVTSPHVPLWGHRQWVKLQWASAEGTFPHVGEHDPMVSLQQLSCQEYFILGVTVSSVQSS